MASIEEIATVRRTLNRARKAYESGEFATAAAGLDKVVKLCAGDRELRHGQIHVSAEALRRICNDKIKEPPHDRT